MTKRKHAGKNIDKMIQRTQKKINKVHKNLKATRTLWRWRVKKHGYTKELLAIDAKLDKETKELQECQNELDACKQERKLQKRIAKLK